MATPLFSTASSKAKNLVNKPHRKPPLIFLCACVRMCVHPYQCIFRAFYIWKLSVSAIKHHSPYSRIHRLLGTIFLWLFFPPDFCPLRSHWQDRGGKNTCVLLTISGISITSHTQFFVSSAWLLNIVQSSAACTIKKEKTMLWHWAFSGNASSEGQHSKCSRCITSPLQGNVVIRVMLIHLYFL